MQEKDQVQGQKPAEQSPKKESSSEKFDKVWDEIELLTKQEAEAKAVKPAQESQKEEGKSTSDSTGKTPFRILKVQGREIPVYSEEELIEFAQKGADYTKKTQTLAEERRAAEAALKEEEKRLADAAFDLNKTLDELVKLKGEKKLSAKPDEHEEKAAIQPEEAKIYEEYGIDPKYAQAHEIKIVKDLADVKAMIRSIQQEKADAEIRRIIAKERETYPYDDIVDDQGNNITETQLASIVMARKQAAEAAKEKPDYQKILRESVQELHLAQKKTRESLSISEGMDIDAFVLKYPELASRLREKFGQKEQQAAQQKSIVPPALPATKRDGIPTTLKPKAVSPTGKSLSDWLDEGFLDPETIKAINGV